MDIEKLKKAVKKNGVKLPKKGIYDVSGGEGCIAWCPAGGCYTTCTSWSAYGCYTFWYS